MMKPYKVVDVFTSAPFLGNPVAVVFDADDLTGDQMQAIARWTNLSETTFVLSPTNHTADYRLRIFTPGSELPFAGHPTLGSAHAVIESGRCVPRDGLIVQECGAGLVPLDVQDKGEAVNLRLRMPQAQRRALGIDDIAELSALLGHPVLSDPAPAIVDVGAIWVVAQLESPQALLDLQPDFARSAAFENRLNVTGLSLFGVYPDGRIETRSFAPSVGANEDPVCGSGNGAIAGYRIATGQIDAGQSYTVRQGCRMNRDGHVSIDTGSDGEVYVGGACVTVVDGSIRVSS